MPAPIGNKSAEKWTLEKTEETLSYMEKFAISESVPLLGQALCLAGLYPDAWAYLRRKWADNDDIIDRIKMIDLQFENKILIGALQRRFHAGVAILCLKHKYHYSDCKPVKEIEIKEEPPYQAPTILVREGYVIEI